MRLSRIKLAGFKSFVDPTTIYLPSNLVGIVGPNGCGKSNVIDAVRWVMGESSARNLRGDSMEDVIFNGSAARKPVGTASIELFFDNSDGAIGGQYAQYAEISLRRVVSRDGVSQYFLNNTRCRRKDITNLFLGTGLGPRSYAIIEQGMVSRLVEGKPDDMRVYIEEAAGISKYKERRRETENRINHTRENLARLNDLRDEVAKQIRHLQRQAQTAEKYRVLKDRERTLEAQMLAMRLRDLDQGLDVHRLALLNRQTAMDAALAEQRQTEAAIEQARSRHVEATDAFNAAQARFYGVQSEISRLEQAIAHHRENRERQGRDLEQARLSLSEVERQDAHDQEVLGGLEARIAALGPALEAARESEADAGSRQQAAEQRLADWQQRWHELNLAIREQERIREVEQTRIEHQQSARERLDRQIAAYSAEHGAISLELLERQLTEAEQARLEAQQRVDGLSGQLAQLSTGIAEQRQADQARSHDIEMLRGQLESCRGQLRTLESVQSAALGNSEEAVSEWLEDRQLGERPRLVQSLDVAGDWSLAVETVLGDFLQAVCVESLAPLLEGLPDTQLALVEPRSGEAQQASLDERYLLAYVRNAGPLSGMLSGIRVAPDLATALSLRAGLAGSESVITRDGIWLGAGWVRISRGQGYTGLIAREQEIRELADDLQRHEREIEQLQGARVAARAAIEELEQRRAETQEQYNEANRTASSAAGTVNAVRQDLHRARNRRESLGADINQLRAEQVRIEEQLEEARRRMSDAAASLTRLGAQRETLEQEQAGVLAECEGVREEAGRAREHAASLLLEHEGARTARDSARAALERVTSQQRQLTERIASLEEQLRDAEVPLADLQAELETSLATEIEVEKTLKDRRSELESVESAVRADESRRTELEKKVSAERESVEQLRIQVRESEVRRETLTERFAVTGLELAEVQAQVGTENTADEWEAELVKVRGQIERLGPINLAAIEEFNEQSERKQYLDSQTEDLSSALATLEHAIRKIDRETRTRFQETFDSINAGLQGIFPRLFGGGHAYLSLEGEDVLTAGVSVMARPPGKRNSHIHLLSGGEKALTAVALIFAIFQLNPAPFCLLDEVDAPLDEANVGRFCDIVREMSESVQFVVITHNKTTMEMVKQLTGVTMSEPGVSRLVSVDIDEAVELVAG
ncbi:MAG: chromosome segregation protein SMC [Chromatiales bacterium]|nr:chromosome segregation protein SMC [Chromatiales bacterium]